MVAVRCIAQRSGLAGELPTKLQPGLPCSNVCLSFIRWFNRLHYPHARPEFYPIAGCNRAGKTTASFTILPETLGCQEFVNADEIARGLSPFQPEKVAMEAGRIMLHRVDDLLARGETFAIETRLATKIYQQKIRAAQQQGYTTTLVYFWLNNPELAQERVKTRVQKSGHYIAPEVIERRYWQGLHLLFATYLPLSTRR